MSKRVVNVVIAGVGGQGVLTATDLLAEAAFRAGLDVKKSEVHGMAQRGGSVCSDVRFGGQVFSPMVPPGEADFLVVLAQDQVPPFLHRLRSGGTLISPADLDETRLPHRRCMNVALLGRLSIHLPWSETAWLELLQARLPAKIFDLNRQAFLMGRHPETAP